jgi:hypothetical protein
MKKIECFELSDGSIVKDMDDAIKKEKEITVKNAITELCEDCSNDFYLGDSRNVSNTIWEYRNALLEILK